MRLLLLLVLAVAVPLLPRRTAVSASTCHFCEKEQDGHVSEYAGAVDAETSEFFRAKGAAVLRGVVGADALALLAEAVDRIEASPGPLAIRMKDESGDFWEDFRRVDDTPELRAAVCRSGLGSVAARLLYGPAGRRGVTEGDEGVVRFFHDHVLVKEPGSKLRTPLHQDMPFYPINGSQTVSLWLPLDAVPRENSMEFVAGSHAPGVMYMPRSFKGNKPLVYLDDGQLPEVPPASKEGLLGWAVQPGDAVAFNMLTLHSAGPAPGHNRRRAVSLRFTGEDVLWAPRPKKTSPPYPEVTLKAGESLNQASDVFPVAGQFPGGGGDDTRHTERRSRSWGLIQLIISAFDRARVAWIAAAAVLVLTLWNLLLAASSRDFHAREAFCGLCAGPSLAVMMLSAGDVLVVDGWSWTFAWLEHPLLLVVPLVFAGLSFPRSQSGAFRLPEAVHASLILALSLSSAVLYISAYV